MVCDFGCLPSIFHRLFAIEPMTAFVRLEMLSHHEIFCYLASMCTHHELRLFRDSSDHSFGIAEVCINGYWAGIRHDEPLAHTTIASKFCNEYNGINSRKSTIIIIEQYNYYSLIHNVKGKIHTISSFVDTSCIAIIAVIN